MKSPVYINGIGVVSPTGVGVEAVRQSLLANLSAVRPLSLFPLLQGEPLPVGQVDFPSDDTFPLPRTPLPRTHMLALNAAREALGGSSGAPDAIVIGTATGGMLRSERLLRDGETDKTKYRYHGLTTVAEVLAREFHCRGPALTVSTACSSGAVALALAVAMLRSGEAETVLVGGAESLCRLTYYGFHSLQLVDKDGCKPLDANRHGMAVGEGAGMLLLSTRKSETTLAEIRGTALTCDAHHPSAPHPDGDGAYRAMAQAIADAGLVPEQIDYINLHGTGTPDNDLAESKAVRRLFAKLPLHSSTKGATGHTLSASGAIEAVLAVLALEEGVAPANTSLQQVDPVLGLAPVTTPTPAALRAVLSNSFGFGGNNGSVVLGATDTTDATDAFRQQEVPGTSAQLKKMPQRLAVHGFSCVSGKGLTMASLAAIGAGETLAGVADDTEISVDLPPRVIRRLQRLPKMALALAKEAVEAVDAADTKDLPHPDAVFLGTGWGSMSETDRFLQRLIETNEQFPSPTDFIGSVHNAAAGQIAIQYGATGANVTASGGDYSFEEALYSATMLLHDGQNGLVFGVDEAHSVIANAFDPSIAAEKPLADGGAALLVSKISEGGDSAKRWISVPFCCANPDEFRPEELVQALGLCCDVAEYGLILVGIPAAFRERGEAQLQIILTSFPQTAPVVRYRESTGEFASASALAVAMGFSFLDSGQVPATFIKDAVQTVQSAAGEILQLQKDQKILILGLGQQITAMVLGK